MQVKIPSAHTIFIFLRQYHDLSARGHIEEKHSYTRTMCEEDLQKKVGFRRNFYWRGVKVRYYGNLFDKVLVDTGFANFIRVFGMNFI